MSPMGKGRDAAQGCATKCHRPRGSCSPPSAPDPIFLAANPHLWSLPIGNGSGVPIKYWSPAIFVLLALLVLFFTYRRTKGEGELLAGAPVVGAAPRWVQQQRVVANPPSLRAPRKAAKCHPCRHGSTRLRAGGGFFCSVLHLLGSPVPRSFGLSLFDTNPSWWPRQAKPKPAHSSSQRDLAVCLLLLLLFY